ncbi:uncharacterized protein K452DRAFT_317537 [Aplosporella prunicola CBS 121167]|uniref:histidine kinase n=1 Tax=Aplosporella prunicola CBS 121167 TaxID=1176127 RepID=A0A6A6BJD1_9PEZI|nr:uncharacterized protein K452DRAFT_317537 [Aplosporella prunicola CBS 121167]KAF2143384.1 hypothetical protein K452DRAFT_317537 [Aplosporella prunicola CBS 121167]
MSSGGTHNGLDGTESDFILKVMDTGKGISPDFLRRGIYTPFQQEDSFSPGAGLGLSIVRQIVEGMKGDIDVQSQTKVGTDVTRMSPEPMAKWLTRRFTILRGTTKKPKDELEVNAEPNVHPLGESTTLRVLVVDDNDINLTLMTAFMKKHNFAYQKATNGLQAVESYEAANGEFDYVPMGKCQQDFPEISFTEYTDLTMPIMDGTTATRQIRRYEQREGKEPTTVIALTVLALDSARDEALNSGVDYFLTKPIDFRNLYLMLQKGQRKS